MCEKCVLKKKECSLSGLARYHGVTVNRNVKSQNHKYWCFKSPCAFSEVSLCDRRQESGGTCVCVCEITGPMFFEQTVKSYCCVFRHSYSEN